MMDSPPELSPPRAPELIMKSLLDPSGLVVRQLTGEHRADDAEEVNLS